jgi:hypothetical protein
MRLYALISPSLSLSFSDKEKLAKMKKRGRQVLSPYPFHIKKNLQK